MFDASPMQHAVASSPIKRQVEYATPTASSAAVVGNARFQAWGTGRGHDTLSQGQFAKPQALNALNSGSFYKFDSGPGFIPVEAR
jgi:hypothetical protein